MVAISYIYYIFVKTYIYIHLLSRRYNDYQTYKKLGDIFKTELNLVMAAQFYSYSCDLLFIQSSRVVNPWDDNGYNNPKKVKDFDDMDPNDQLTYVYLLLDKGTYLLHLLILLLSFTYLLTYL